ncbi:helicase [Longibacter salinarum]|uniref:Helicase n=2 Tax=Longibacter salinarum TaxID=1850348 RepID=A0A2A8D1N6_9BACT|nr:helicase [Longibacter salinarum]
MGALHASLAHWTVTREVGTVVMPTGTGKTETMLALFARERLEKLLVVVPTSALRDQIARKFLTMGVLPDFGIVDRDVQLPVVGRMEHRFDTPEEARHFQESCNVVVATMSVIGGCTNEVKDALATGCSHLFIDEAHHVPAKTWSAFKERAREHGKPILQFTATPYRRDGKHIGGKSIFTYPLRKAQQEGYFAPIKFISIWEYNRDLADEAVARRAIGALRSDRESGLDHLLMARTERIHRAEEVHEVYARLAPDLHPLIVHNRMGAREQTAAIEALMSRRSRVIVCVNMLGEGFDLPQLKIAAIHDVHKSMAVTIQFVGRFARVAGGLGDATVVANAADADVEEAIDDLYVKDADWNDVLQRLSEGETSRQRRRSELMRGFQTSPGPVPLQNIRPKMSTVAYRTQCEDWRPHKLDDYLKDTPLLVEPTVNPSERVLFYITREEQGVAWGETRAVSDLVHDLYLAYWDEERALLFINSTNNDSLHRKLAEVLVGEDARRIQGERIYKSFHDINRLTLSNLGLSHLHSQATQFTMHVGSDIREGLSPASVENRRKANIFSRGFETGESVTIGASHKGRVWSYKVAEGFSDWMEWCGRVGDKLLDPSASTEEILEHAIIPKIIEERPSLVPTHVQWPFYFLKRSEEAIWVEVAGHTAPFYESEIRITTFKEEGPLRFEVVVEEASAEYEVVLGEEEVQYIPVGQEKARLRTTRREQPLGEWFQEEPPHIWFEDTSKLDYNEIYQPKGEREPYDRTSIEAWSWEGVQIRKESQYKKKTDPRRLELRSDSVQRHVIDRMQGDYGADYDIIFDDDGKGEIADVVGLKATGEQLLVHFLHLKYSKSESAGVRVDDFYEVCGQAQRSVYWRGAVQRLFSRMKLREQKRQENYGVSRFERGDLQKLDELSRRAKQLVPRFRIFVVQPGLEKESVNTRVLDLLGATEVYLKETFGVPLTVISS